MTERRGNTILSGGKSPGYERQAMKPRVLLLGGTGEGNQLAARLSQRADLSVISSLAGRVNESKLPEGAVRVGGFGGLDALVSYLVKEKIAVVIDATHPFAARIGQNVEKACSRTGLPLVALNRPPWQKVNGDQWHEVDDFQSAAMVINAGKARAFLSIGRQELGSFFRCNDAWFLIRAIEKPPEKLPPHHSVVLQRGPFKFEDELQLLRDHSIEYVVSKNSGGLATYAKIEAARLLGIPVIMVKRPMKHTVSTVETVEDAVANLDRLLHRCSGQAIC